MRRVEDGARGADHRVETTLLELVWKLSDVLPDESAVTCAVVDLISTGSVRSPDGRPLALAGGGGRPAR